VAAHKRNEQLASGNNSFSLSSSFLSQGASPPSERTSYNFGYDRDSRDAHNAGPLPHGGGHDPYAQLHAPPAINPLDAVIPRPVLIHIVDLYFDYVYCLIPCLHKPSFLHDLHSHREEQPGQDEWVALVFAVVEATLVQMPQSFVSLPRREIKILFSRVNSLVKSFLDQDFHTLTVTRMIILYFHAIATHSMGNPLAGDTIFGASYLLALRLHLHEESVSETILLTC
jgi:hypothetical protein